MKKQHYIAEAWLVIVLSLVFGAGLAAVQATLQPLIEKNKQNDTLGQIPHLVAGATDGKSMDVGGRRVYQALDESGQPVGWIVPASGQGFADRLELLVGLDRDASHLTGLYVLDQKETPGLGNKIVETAWRDQFKGKPLDRPLVVVKRIAAEDREVQAVTGATISSDSVVEILNRTLAAFRAELNAAAPQGATP